MTERTWYYKDGLDKEPIPVLIVGGYDFGNFSVIHYRKVEENGNLLPVEEVINYYDENKFGLNEMKQFPEIKIHYCKNCGHIQNSVVIDEQLKQDIKKIKEQVSRW